MWHGQQHFNIVKEKNFLIITVILNALNWKIVLSVSTLTFIFLHSSSPTSRYFGVYSIAVRQKSGCSIM